MSILCVFMRLFFYSLYFVVAVVSCNKTSCHQLFRPQLLPGYLLLLPTLPFFLLNADGISIIQ